MNKNHFLLIILLSLLIKDVLSAVCMRDELITNQASTEVSWWMIIKIKGFSDLYRYFDSEMDATGQDKFQVGYFLRSKYSAFGATLLPYSTQKGVRPTDTGFLAYNDNILNDELLNDNSFYQAGAHEKGIIGWSKTSSKGMIIQHSLPKFPNGPTKTGMNSPILNDKVKDLKDDKTMKIYFTTYGWQANFFGPNLMPYYIPVKPSQQIFCSSLIDDHDTGAGPGEKVKEMVQFLSNLSDKGLYSGKFSDQATFINDKDKNGHVSYPGTPTKLKPERPKDQNSMVHKEIKVGTYTYYMRINNGNDESDNGNGKTVDIWKSLTNNANEPKFADTDKEFVISTWINSKRKGWWANTDPNVKTKIKTPIFKIDAHDNTFYWKGNTNQEHSKIGFKTEATNGEKWNVCSSGGNLYYDGKKGIKSSLLICWNSNGLRSALASTLTDVDIKDDASGAGAGVGAAAAGGSAAAADDSGDDDGDEEKIAATPAKYNQNQNILKTFKGTFKEKFDRSLQNVKNMARMFQHLEKQFPEIIDFDPKAFIAPDKPKRGQRKRNRRGDSDSDSSDDGMADVDVVRAPAKKPQKKAKLTAAEREKIASMESLGELKHMVHNTVPINGFVSLLK
ncbi:hypothetical protein CYY_001124 [Polysphondylium violaceum]|uniref:Uncharacterized protein n=1 Tax=Polysphondylium violaceum TaxID=133409 RepID=A0A8J4PYP4_9MYCE|nr:hypothetical protein CYY_001124 [Polysphondylium violaceum]